MIITPAQIITLHNLTLGMPDSLPCEISENESTLGLTLSIPFDSGGRAYYFIWTDGTTGMPVNLTGDDNV